MSEPSSSIDREQRRREQARQVRSGCAGCFVFVFAVLLFFGGVAGFEHWLRTATVGSGEGVVVIARPETHAHVMVWVGLFTSVALVFALNVKTTRRAIVQVVVVLGLAAAVVVLACYRQFEAVRPDTGSKIELRYLWPRPGVVIDASRATFRHALDYAPADDLPGPANYLEIYIDGASYRSAESGNVEEVKRLLLARGAREIR